MCVCVCVCVCVCGDWMKILKKKEKKKSFFFWGGEGGLDFFFSNWEKSHLNPIGKGAEFRPLRTQIKSLIGPVSLQLYI